MRALFQHCLKNEALNNKLAGVTDKLDNATKKIYTAGLKRLSKVLKHQMQNDGFKSIFAFCNEKDVEDYQQRLMKKVLKKAENRIEKTDLGEAF